MEYITWNFNDGDLQALANWIKAKLLIRLEKDKLLTKSATEISREYQLVIVKKGWFGRFVDKLFGLKDNDKKLHFVVMKIPADEFEEPEAPKIESDVSE